MPKRCVFYRSEGTNDTACLLGEAEDVESLKRAAGEFFVGDIDSREPFTIHISFRELTDDEFENLPEV